IPGYETGTELALASSNERCVDCHMGTPTKQVIAPHISKEGEPPLVRDVRSHLFAGARNSDILSTTLNLLVDATPGKATVRIQNLTPHRVPTGFSGRSGVLEVVFFNGSKVIQTQRAEFRAIHLNQEGQETLSYTATRLKSDTRLKPYEIKTLTFVSPKEATKVEAHLSYFLLSPSLHETLGIEDPVFTRPYPIAKAAAFFK
ncbi:MAG: hypothetical protein IBX45_11465, partial [Campylobacterales bacterium]|nr:hypothetical protein [Campylobacterales bacterium]